jgi:hypothetical protein
MTRSMSDCSLLNQFWSHFLGRLKGQLCVVWYVRAFRGGEEVGTYRKRRITRPCIAMKADNKTECMQLHFSGRLEVLGVVGPKSNHNGVRSPLRRPS